MKASEKLATALREANAPDYLIRRAEMGYYGDYTSPLGAPISTLVRHLTERGLHSVALKAIQGEFDGE